MLPGTVISFWVCEGVKVIVAMAVNMAQAVSGPS